MQILPFSLVIDRKLYGDQQDTTVTQTFLIHLMFFY